MKIKSAICQNASNGRPTYIGIKAVSYRSFCPWPFKTKRQIIGGTSGDFTGEDLTTGELFSWNARMSRQKYG